jgi:hypothetical protein
MYQLAGDLVRSFDSCKGVVQFVGDFGRLGEVVKIGGDLVRLSDTCGEVGRITGDLVRSQLT